eukprot:2039645-Amphidinium_carterae.1
MLPTTLWKCCFSFLCWQEVSKQADDDGELVDNVEGTMLCCNVVLVWPLLHRKGRGTACIPGGWTDCLFRHGPIGSSWSPLQKAAAKTLAPSIDSWMWHSLKALCLQAS